MKEKELRVKNLMHTTSWNERQKQFGKDTWDTRPLDIRGIAECIADKIVEQINCQMDYPENICQILWDCKITVKMWEDGEL